MYKMNQHNPMLSKHFDLFTLCASETAEENGLHNLPQADEVFQNLRSLCEAVLDPIVEHFDLPLSVTSGYRNAALNSEVGGLEQSQHLIGQAADIMVGGLRNDELAHWIKDNLIFDELILEKFAPSHGEFGWVHVSYNLTQNRGKVTSFDGSSYVDGLQSFDDGGLKS